MTDNNITDFGTVEPFKPGAAIEQNAIKQKTGYKSLFERFEEYETDMKATPQTITTGFAAVDEDLKFNGFTMLGGASGAGVTCPRVQNGDKPRKYKRIYYKSRCKIGGGCGEFFPK